jgi:hypothetical protein
MGRDVWWHIGSFAFAFAFAFATIAAGTGGGVVVDRRLQQVAAGDGEQQHGGTKQPRAGDEANYGELL